MKRWIKRIVLTLGALYLIGMVLGAYLFTHPRRGEPGTLPDGMTEVTVHGDVDLAAWVREGSGGAVLLLHGYRESRAQMRTLTEMFLSRTRLTVLVPDFRGCGRSPGAACSAGPAEVADVAAALAFLRRKGVPSERVAVVGFSMGGVAAIGASRERELAGVVALSPYTSLEQAFDARTRRWAKLPARPWFTPMLWCVEKFCRDDVMDFDITIAALGSKAHARLVLGLENDWRAPPSAARAVAAAWAAPVRIYPGEGHTPLQHEAVRQHCFHAVTSWLSR